MKPIILAALLSSFAVFSAGPVAADFSRITSEDQLRSQLVGKKMYDEHGNWFRWNADGTMSGHLKSGKKFVGVWKWSKKFVCRNGLVADKELGTDCQLIEIDGAAVRFTRKKGKGKSSLLTLK